MKKGWGFFISIVVIALDQWSKHWVLHNLAPYKPKMICPMFNLMLAFNTGSAFSFLSQAGYWHRWFFMAFSFTMSVAIIVWILRLPQTARLQSIALSLILGGAVGNLLDRIFLGHVIDFIQVYYTTHYWPVFNLADSAICVGAGLLLLEAVFFEQSTDPSLDRE